MKNKKLQNYDFEKLKKERIEDNKSRERDKKFFRYYNKYLLIKFILGLLITLVVFIFFYKKLK